MQFHVSTVPVHEILPWRELYRQEMNCQIVHDSLHSRAGWTESYLFETGPNVVGYGAVAVAGPWKGTKTVFEFHVAPEYRPHSFEIFEGFAAVAGITAFEVQTNDILPTLMMHTWCRSATSEKIVFHEKLTTSLPTNGAILRRSTPADQAQIFPHHHEPVGDWLLQFDGAVVATGGILFHYNRPYGDIYMEVDARFRQRGFGSYLVQELKRLCHESGSVPCARCSPTNLASRKTLAKTGFVACAHILVGQFHSTLGGIAGRS
ncbi:MAG TPA: GNAT family N-acetyltransferase [Lacunisphaera sp.]|jgi:GNAT superfamily N-acetyltransferase